MSARDDPRIPHARRLRELGLPNPIICRVLRLGPRTFYRWIADMPRRRNGRPPGRAPAWNKGLRTGQRTRVA